ncbi:Molybdopterin-binding domain of aldehyde dehydrogenase-domain-containing protein [Sphaerosporella brunnea]|uniref:xanthine dehydrogenase n=1 Tax=Sphaerosporella brunnea TaxID=1250544 RepID=A0A5J5F112_9PEZI|nr:Molybdopterin-binding domain of aldehyde dehydrogenase-domain-containing protein [Sphaerosporella brunnea]
MAPPMELPTPAADLPAPAAPASPAKALTPLVNSIFTSSTLSFHLNGQPITLQNPSPTGTLLDFLRLSARLTGTKLGCGEGGCGACTVILQSPSPSPSTQRPECVAVNACLAPLVSVDGKQVLTVEALGTAEAPHPLQRRMAEMHASQCGFCTPGIVMSVYAAVRNAESKGARWHIEEEELLQALDGNLCRCTGYKTVLEAARAFVVEDLGGVVVAGEGSVQERVERTWGSASADRKLPSCGRPGGCCRDSPDAESACESSGEDKTQISTPATTPSPPPVEVKPSSPHTELLFPPALRKQTPKPLCFGNSEKIWFRPVTLKQLLQLKHAFPSAKLVGGATEVQVEVRFKGCEYPVCVYVSDIPELKMFSVDEQRGEVVVGGNTTLSVVERECALWVSRLAKRGQGLEALRRQLRYFAGRQIRNTATMAGNIATASPISDLNPLLLGMGAKVIAHSISRGGEVINTTEFFLGYRTTALPADAVITKIVIPLQQSDGREIVKTYKQAKRKEDDIAIVTAGLRVRLGEGDIVEDVCLAYGGMAPVTVEAKNTQQILLGKKWFDPAVLEEATNAMEKDFDLSYSIPGGMPTYRKTLAFTFFFRFWHEVAAELKLGEVDASLISDLPRDTPFTGSRDHDNPHAKAIVGQQIPHVSGLKHATGEAEYVDDIPKQEGELFGGLVLSTKAHAKLVEVDPSPALEMPGVVGFIDHHDIPEERSLWGAVVKDERFFAKDTVHAHGVPIGMVLAETAEQAQAAAKAVKVVYEDLNTPLIISIDDAIKADSFFPNNRILKRGLPIEEALSNSEHVFTGVSRIGGQEHFYLETQAALAIPKETGEMEIWSSTQNTKETQEYVAQVVGVPSNRIVARVKRMGGAFGGKELRSIPLPCMLAVAAKKLGRPCRAMLNRDEDMMMTGQRNPFMAQWRVGVTKDGLLQAFDADVYNNAGHSLDVSAAVMERCLTHIDNTYWIPNVHVRGHVCKTNIHSNTAFRGFGGPQGNYIAECVVTTVADKLGIDVDEIRWKNLYKEGQLTPYLQPLVDWHIPEIMEELKNTCSLEKRKAEVQEFNRKNKYKKRGLAMLPTKFGISFATACHLNQAGALIHIYTDGSVLLAHGGTEMGQGLYTKMLQVCAEELQVPLSSIFTSDSSSATVANPSSTAASSGSDLNGMAIKVACAQLNSRLLPYRTKFNNDMKAMAQAAYFDRVNLSANGYYKTPGLGFQWGNYKDPLPLYSYFTQGAACSEVEVDVLTGDHVVARTDILMDVGHSINPAIDYGQIEGAFVQGMGLFTMEETLWHSNGTLFTRGPGTYKIPGAADVPRSFNTRLLKMPKSQWKNLRSIQSSKGIGEPPLFLGASVLFALREAVKAAREGAGEGGARETVVLDSPATCERVRAAVGGGVWQRMKVEREEGRSWVVCAQGVSEGL